MHISLLAAENSCDGESWSVSLQALKACAQTGNSAIERHGVHVEDQHWCVNLHVSTVCVFMKDWEGKIGGEMFLRRWLSAFQGWEGFSMPAFSSTAIFFLFHLRVKKVCWPFIERLLNYNGKKKIAYMCVPWHVAFEVLKKRRKEEHHWVVVETFLVLWSSDFIFFCTRCCRSSNFFFWRTSCRERRLITCRRAIPESQELFLI